MKLAELVTVLDHLAPIRYAEPWDNVGLLAGDPAQSVSRVMLTVDYTPAVAEEARAERCDAVVSYHPPIFQPIKRLVGPDPVFDALRAGIAIYSPHTALDVAAGGTNDVLADALGLDDRAPLRLAPLRDAEYKLVTFAPQDAVEKVAQALFDAGAGRIGNYSACSFRSPGTGTFFGEAGTDPVVGRAGRLETAPEIRIETVVPIGNVDRVVRALRAAHPYETPAFDLVRLAAPPEGIGIGRVGAVSAMPCTALIERVKQALGLRHLLVAGPVDREVRRAAVCAGAGADLLGDALAAGAELYLTGELRHHDALRAARAGVTVVSTLHSNSERSALIALAGRLAERLPGVSVSLSRVDRDPFEIR